MKQFIKNNIKKFLRKTQFMTCTSRDEDVIIELKKTFAHNERSLVYGFRTYFVDSLYCHASPGVLETIVLELKKRQIEFPDKKTLVNLGGGTGQVSDIFRVLGFDVYNLDIEIAEPDERNIKFDLNSSLHIPLEPNQSDIVVCAEIIEHVENPWKLFRDACAMLVPGGVLIVTTPNVQSSFSRWKMVLTGYFHWFTPECFSFHINPVFTWELMLIAKKTGFKLVSQHGSGEYFARKKVRSNKHVIRNNESLISIFIKTST